MTMGLEDMREGAPMKCQGLGKTFCSAGGTFVFVFTNADWAGQGAQAGGNPLSPSPYTRRGCLPFVLQFSLVGTQWWLGFL